MVSEQAAGTPPAFSHYSVLLRETVDALNIRPDGTYLDGTAGGGGHCAEILKHLGSNGRLIAVDKDPAAVAVVAARFAGDSRVTVVREDFRNLATVVSALGLARVDGILLDLGVSSYQFDTPERGFSYRFDAPLDMRMAPDQELSAAHVVNDYSAQQLTKIFRDYGEEKFASPIAAKIVAARQAAPVTSTLELVGLIKLGIPAAARRTGGHPAKKVFQAIRIEVNAELLALTSCLQQAFDCLQVAGRLAVITFHSLEDRIVKRQFLAFAQGCTCPPGFPVCICGKTPQASIITKKPILASQQELEENHRSHSAKLRVVERLY